MHFAAGEVHKLNCGAWLIGDLYGRVHRESASTASGTVINDTVTVNARNQAFGANSATATDVVSTAAQADLALSTAATPVTVFPGNDITYTQTVTNNGPAAASGITFLEAVPTNTTFASVSAPVGWTCTTPAVGGTGNVSCTDTSMASGVSANITVVVNLAATVTVATITANSSVLFPGTNDPNPANNSTTVVTNVAAVCDLAVTNSGSPNPVAAGWQYCLHTGCHQHRPQQLQHGDVYRGVSQLTPRSFRLRPVPAGWTCTTTGSISCTNPSVAPDSTSTFPVMVDVNTGTARQSPIP